MHTTEEASHKESEFLILDVVIKILLILSRGDQISILNISIGNAGD